MPMAYQTLRLAPHLLGIGSADRKGRHSTALPHVYGEKTQGGCFMAMTNKERNQAKYQKNREAKLATVKERQSKNKIYWSVNQPHKEGEFKLCRCCDSLKPTKAFAKNIANNDGLQSQCKSCLAPKDNARSRSRRKPKARAKRIKTGPSPDALLRERITGNLRKRIRDVLKGETKSGRSMSLIGCTGEELKLHLEAQFLPLMDWSNYGPKGWHIDHIRPCASFDLSDPAQQKECFHYTNLQPLWSEENTSKGARWAGN